MEVRKRSEPRILGAEMGMKAKKAKRKVTC